MTEPVTLTTGRLVLRPYRLSDADAVFERACDPEFGRFLPLPQPYSRSHAETFVAQQALRPWSSHPTFAIELEGRCIGDVNVRVDAENRRASFGYGIDRRYWRQGITFEAARAVLTWAFETFDLVRMEATADMANVGSWGVMEKLGMTREAVMRSYRQHAVSGVTWCCTPCSETSSSAANVSLPVRKAPRGCPPGLRTGLACRPAQTRAG